ncbi:SH3 domain-containing YSC84-like protein 1 [Hondaea fermentalgiana]|uniref:SH3 domain-containing YSC84-like protein 1 n=1 Tax=Hondaea fermentalgiana TaxID=2315210 RepID=A0A2R5GDC6_9STRA|nr:SH3 domain-containing YSC84-like protein 1 [Hondaea fermentalgiana]|eukprot:GBG28962.1 SH3 domain-containing YSC84-like protein 1 [Hondaea fermentalgiana]
MGISDRIKLRSTVPNAAKTLNEMANPKYVSQDKAIPRMLLQHCKGIAFVTVYKAGIMMIGGNVGGGCVVVKVKDSSQPGGYRWSAPLSVQAGGLGGGFVFGAEKISSVIILNTTSAIKGFTGDKQISFGGSASLAVGPVGRNAEASVGLSDNKKIVPAYSYSLAKGAYIGGTLEGAILKVNDSDNREFYGRDVTPAEILGGHVDPPPICNVLYETLHEIMGVVMDSGTGASSPQGPQRTSLAQGASQGLGASGKALLRSGFSDADNEGNDGLPPGWKQAYAEDGRAYYYNDKGETSWERPAAPRRPGPPPPPPKTQPPASLPAGWQELTAPDGRKYYAKGSTTQWERPTA